MTAPYYVGDDIPLRFAVLEDGKPIFPTAVTVAVFNPIGGLVEEGVATVQRNEVNYVIPSHVTSESGEFTVVFKVRLFNLGIRTHTMKVEVNPLPTSEEERPASDTLEVAGEERDALEESWEIAGTKPQFANSLAPVNSW